MYSNMNNYFVNNNEEIIEIKEVSAPTKFINAFIKCLLIGSSGVGKSSILERYVSNNFHQHFITTIGVDYKFKDIVIDNYKIKLQLWDTASQERFRCITSNYYRNSHIIIICFDITDYYSFNELNYWIEDALRYVAEPVLMVICGTKVDLTKKRIISYEEAKNFALNKNMEYFEISSKTGEGIELMFNKILKIKLSEPEFIKIQVEPATILEEKYEVLRLSDNNNYNYDYQIGCCQQYY